MSNLITELFNAYTMLDFSSDEDKERKKEYLDDIKDFALSGSYTTTKHKEYLLKNFMKPIQDQAEDLNLSKAAVYKNRNLILKDLENRLGYRVIKNVLSGNLDEVDKVLAHNMTEQSLSDVVIKSVLDSVKSRSSYSSSKKKAKYDLVECVDELNLLKKYSVLELELLLDRLDMEKLNYLFRLINFEESNVDDRVKLMEYIKK